MIISDKLRSRNKIFLEKIDVSPSSFFSPVYRRPTDPNFWHFQKKKHRNDVVTPFFTWNNSFTLKNEKKHREKQEQKHEHFSQHIVHFVNPDMWMLTFNVLLGYQGLLFRDFLWFFLGFFFSIRPTDPILRNAFDGKRREKRGRPWCYKWRTLIANHQALIKAFVSKTHLVQEAKRWNCIPCLKAQDPENHTFNSGAYPLRIIKEVPPGCSLESCSLTPMER